VSTSPLPQPEDRTLTVNGLELHFHDWGSPDKPPLVLVHGLSGNAWAFAPFARRMRDRLHIIALDVRGHGDSAWSPDGAYSFADQANELAAFVDQLGLERFSLLGTSMGGMISLRYAGDHVDRLERLVINDIGPEIESGSVRITQTTGARPSSFASADEAIDYGISTRPNLAILDAEQKRELLRGGIRRTPDGQWTWKVDPEYARQRVKFGAKPRPAWDTLTKVTCPTLVLWGTQSDVLSEGQAKRMVDALPNGELISVPGVGHAPVLLEPAAYAALERFLVAS
jgi:pimeloyl-ACP methyl ester carboxylesterase